MAAKKWGWWTQHKLQILEEYLAAFAKASQQVDQRIYLDLFAGWPQNQSRETDETILGSAYRAIRVQPPFTRVGLFELGRKAQRLETAIRIAFPGRPGIKVFRGDCNNTVREALRELRPINWAPTFAFIDQFASEIKWSTLEQLAQFRKVKNRTKAELWILFAPGMYGRGLAVRQEAMNARYGDTLTAMIGSEEWIPIVEDLRDNLLSPAEAYTEWLNLFQWRLENVLGYQHTYSFTMKNTSGRDLYEMVFATDHPAGNRIMRSLYGAAMSKHSAMRNHALALRREQRLEQTGADALFPLAEDMVAPTVLADEQVYDPQPPMPPYGQRRVTRP